jgi:hypothetical protein
MQIGRIIEIRQFPNVVPFKVPKSIPEKAPQRVENWPVREKESVPLTPQKKENYG